MNKLFTVSFGPYAKTVPLVSKTFLGLRPRAILETSGIAFFIRILPVNNICVYVRSYSYGCFVFDLKLHFRNFRSSKLSK